MESFKLLAIRPLEGCAEQYLKVITAGQYYYFYSGYKFSEDKIIETSMGETDLDSDRKISLNISVIVGGNGSGKSSLVELFYLALFNLSVKSKILPEFNDDGDMIIYADNVRVDIYFETNKVVKRLRVLIEKLR